MNDKERLIQHILNGIEFSYFYYDCLGDSEDRIKQVIKEILEVYEVKHK